MKNHEFANAPTKRNTVQRQLITSAIMEIGHPSAEQVYEHIIKTHPSISKATVYRNLSSMAETGEILAIGIFNGAAHYDHQLHGHCHFVCQECNEIINIDTDFSYFFQKAKFENDLQIENAIVTFGGYCKACKS